MREGAWLHTSGGKNPNKRRPIGGRREKAELVSLLVYAFRITYTFRMGKYILYFIKWRNILEFVKSFFLFRIMLYIHYLYILFLYLCDFYHMNIVGLILFFTYLFFILDFTLMRGDWTTVWCIIFFCLFGVTKSFQGLVIWLCERYFIFQFLIPIAANWCSCE